MKTCKWCGELSDKLVEHRGQKICEKCSNSVKARRCRRCGAERIDKQLLNISGLCADCLQIENAEKFKNRELAKAGLILDEDDDFFYSEETTLSQKDFEDWMTFNPIGDKGFSPKRLLSDNKVEARTARRLWIIAKLALAGSLSEEVINNNMDDIDEMMIEHMSELLGQKCRLVITTDENKIPEGGRLAIAHKNRVWILPVD